MASGEVSSKMPATAVDLLRDDARFLPLVDAYLANTLADLRDSVIVNPYPRRNLYRGIAQAYVAKGELAAALEYSDKARALEPKDTRYLVGITVRARLAAEKASGSRSLDDPAFKEAYRAALREGYAQVPTEVRGALFAQIIAQAARATPALFEGSIAAQLDPLIAAGDGVIDGETLQTLIDHRDLLAFRLPALPIAAEICGELLAAAEDQPKTADLWTPRLAALDPAERATPTVVAIWDTGIDLDRISANLWRNQAEQVNGKDDDGNGIVDDVHGHAFVPNAAAGAVLLGRLADRSASDKATREMVGRFAGRLDMEAGIDSPRARALTEILNASGAEGATAFMAEMATAFDYVHGTFVAGVAVERNPFVRVISVEGVSMGTDAAVPGGPVGFARLWAEFCMQNVAALKKANARVVNMSWALSPRNCREAVEMVGAGDSPEERRKLGREMHQAMRDGLRRAIESAPEMLFVCVAGNDDRDVDFEELMPACLRLPNLLTIGATNERDRLAGFTNTGSTVELFANGDLIEGVLPGGERARWSGTSLAAPQVSALAAMILSLRPELTTAQVIALIRANADPLPDHEGRWIVNPRRTIEALRKAL